MHFVCLLIGDNYNVDMNKYVEYQEDRLYKYHILEESENGVKLIGTQVEIEMMEYRHDLDGKEMVDESGQKYFWSTHNPDAKWDYWVIGGRWRGLLKLKQDRQGNIGASDIPEHYQEGRKALEKILAEQMPGAVISGHDEFTLPPDGFCDQARFGDIDWVSMNDNPEKRETFGFIWYGLMLPEKERPEKFERCFPGWCRFDSDHYIECYGSEQKFIDSNVIFSTSSVLTADGQWHEPEPGRFMHLRHECREDWEKWESGFWDRFLKDLPDDTLITVADCHI